MAVYVVRSTRGAASVDNCTDCPAGFRCPESPATAYGLQCDVGYFCPPGSAIQTICQPGELHGEDPGFPLSY